MHRSNSAVQEMEQLGFEYVFNLPYSPDYNPIEVCFAQIKHEFKRLRTDKLIKGQPINTDELIRLSITRLSKDTIAKSIERSWKLI